MNLKIRIFRMFSNGIHFAKSESEKEEMQSANALLYLLFVMCIVFSGIEFFYALNHQILLNLIIIIPAVISYVAINNGYYNLAKPFFFQLVIVFTFCTNLCYNQSTSFLYIYLITIMNVAVVFRSNQKLYITIFILECVIMFFSHIILADELSNLIVISAMESETHKEFATIILLVFLIANLFFNVLMIQYRESKLKRRKANLIGVQNKFKSQNNDLQQLGLAVTHSLKTPLILTSGFLNKIKNDLIDNPNKQNNNYFRIVKESNRLIEKYSEDLIAYNSVVNIRNQPELFDIVQEIHEQIKLLKVRFENAIIKNQGANIMIKSDRLLFDIIIQTLIENAIIYNDSPSPTLLINSVVENNKMNIYFQDNGIGINQEFRENIFLPFVRINKKVNVTGSGLGLTSAKIACDKIDAKISLLESSPEGSIFKLEL